MVKKDAELIYQGYMDYFDSYVQKKIYTLKEARRRWQTEAKKLRKTLVMCGSESLTEVEKREYIRDTKYIYLEFCRCVKSCDESINESDKRCMYTLLGHISEFEAQIVDRYRYQLEYGDRFDLKKVLSENASRTQIAQRVIDKLLDQYFDDSNNNTCYLGEERVYITESGKKFHTKECTYCKADTQRMKVKFRLADNYGLEPCKCILKQRALQEEQNRFMTVFIDESIRNNPWKMIDDTCKYFQGSYSYIICQGRMVSEKEITKEKTVASSSGLLEEAVGTTNAAIETINNVLMKLAFVYGFTKDVIIYTDNQGASCTWEQNEQNKYLTTLFDSVKVLYIPREENTIADSIGREVAFFDIPTSVMEKIIYKCKVYDEIYQKIVHTKSN